MALAVGAVAMADTSFNPFDDWQMDVETNLDDILNSVTSAPVAAATAASLDVLIKVGFNHLHLGLVIEPKLDNETRPPSK